MSEPTVSEYFNKFINNGFTEEELKQFEEKSKLKEIENEKKENERKLNAAKENRNRFYEINNQLPINSINIKIEDLKNENNDIFELIKKWDVFNDDYGFCICGPVGTGKTHALLSILNLITNELAENKYSSIGNVIWSTSSMLLENLKDSFSDNGSESVLDKIKKLQNIRYLFIDDFGAHKTSDFDIDKLISILDFRVNNNFPTFFSTNCKIDQMKETFGERIFSRIIATSIMVEIKGKDKRIDIHAKRLKDLKNRSNL